MGDKVGENPAARSAAVFLLSAKNRRGVFKHLPQQGEGLENPAATYTHKPTSCKMLSFFRRGGAGRAKTHWRFKYDGWAFHMKSYRLWIHEQKKSKV